MDRFGFSTGALEKGNYRSALAWMQQHDVQCVELSALRFDELKPLVDEIDELPLDCFSYISFHAPSSFSRDKEEEVVSLLGRIVKKKWNIVVHPDVIYTPHLWTHFGSYLLLENMDRRKSIGRSAKDFDVLFRQLPDARFCVDVAHARQLDTTLTLLHDLVFGFRERIAEVHISELNSRCQHRPLSEGAVTDYKKFASWLQNVPVIIESALDGDLANLRQHEMRLSRLAMLADANGQFFEDHPPQLEIRRKTAS